MVTSTHLRKKPPPYLIPDDGTQGCRIPISEDTATYYGSPDFQTFSNQNAIELFQPKFLLPKQPSSFKGLRYPWMVLFEQAFRCHVFPTSRPRLQCFLELLYTFWIWRITMKQQSRKSEYVCGMKTYHHVVRLKKPIRSSRRVSKLVENTLIGGVL